MSERLYTAAEVAELQQSEVQLILKGLLRDLQYALVQRASGGFGAQADRFLQQGEIWGLNVAIKAVKRRIR